MKKTRKSVRRKPQPRKSPTSHEPSEFSFSNVALYAEKDEFISKGLEFTIKTIEYEEHGGWENAPRWVLTVHPGDGRTDELLTFGSNPKRDEQFRAIRAHIEAHGPIRGVRLKRSGNAYYLESTSHPKTA
jgi:hypothetical protein